MHFAVHPMPIEDYAREQNALMSSDFRGLITVPPARWADIALHCLVNSNSSLGFISRTVPDCEKGTSPPLLLRVYPRNWNNEVPFTATAAILVRLQLDHSNGHGVLASATGSSWPCISSTTSENGSLCWFRLHSPVSRFEVLFLGPCVASFRTITTAAGREDEVRFCVPSRVPNSPKDSSVTQECHYPTYE